ncbi:hypothetical protein F4802DRAFT_591127, partial [Xylaria palmicola]
MYRQSSSPHILTCILPAQRLVMKTTKIKDCTDEKIIELCHENGKGHITLYWVDTQDSCIEIDKSIVAIAVDTGASRGYMRVFDKKQKQLGIVKKDEQGFTVIVWVETGYRCMVFAQCRVATLSVTSSEV